MMQSARNRFLLVCNVQDRAWPQILAAALTPLGELELASEEEVGGLLLDHAYDIVVLDATSIGNVPLMTSGILADNPDARVLVVTASPTWRRARAALLAGAVHYLPKTLDQAELLSAFEAVLGNR